MIASPAGPASPACLEPRVLRVAKDRLRIEAPNLLALRVWLGRHRDVASLSEGASALEVTYREPEGDRGAFLRSLRDRLVLVHARPASRAPRISLAHRTHDRGRFVVENLDDDGIARLAAWFAAQPGVTRARASPASASIVVSFDPEIASCEALLEASERSERASWPEPLARESSSEWARSAFNTAVLGASLTGALPLPLVGAAVAVTAIPSLTRAFQAARERRASVDLLDLAAIGISIGTGRPETAAFVTWLLGVGDLVLAHTAARARKAISGLMSLDTQDAWRLGPGGAEKVAVKALAAGDRIVVEPGGRIAADGVVALGEALVDEKALTGESSPRLRREGDPVLAASVVVEGQIVVRVSRVGTDTTAAKIVQILEGAGAKPMTLQRETERFADRLVLPTFAVAGGAAFLASQIERATSVLITDFGTGIRIAVPTSALAAMTSLARRGVLVKGGQFLERLSRADVIVFDKTGTLTAGQPRVVSVLPLGTRSVQQVLAFAASAEERQSHPVADALRAEARSLGAPALPCEVGSEKVTIGVGLSARVAGERVLVGGARLMMAHGLRVSERIAHEHEQGGASTLFVAIGGRVEAILAYADSPRAEAHRVVSALKAGGRRRVLLMSGDAERPVRAVAHAVGADGYFSELLPEHKAEKVRELQREGRIVARVGDGINDSPALALADVGISLEGGTEAALETADVVLLKGGLTRLPEAFALADRAMGHVRRGLGLVIVPNAIAIGLGALGLLSPGAAAVINNGSTVVAALAAMAPLLERTPR